MGVFSDDFERADGGLGNNWSTVSGSATISSGRVTCTSNTVVRQTTINASGRQDAIYVVYVSAIGDLLCGPVLKLSSSQVDGYHVYATANLTVPQWHIRRLTAGSYVTDNAINGQTLAVGSHTIRFLYDNAILTLWVDGLLIMSVSDATHGGNTGAGIRAAGGTTGLDSYTLYGDEATAFSISPSAIGNYGTTATLTATGVGTAWTSGTPGAPTFTCDHGTITAQTVDSATSATLTYDPGNYLGTVTFADPTTGATDTLTVTSDPEVIPPGDQCPFDEDFVTTANATVVAGTRGLPTLQSIIVPAAHGWSDVYLQEAIADLWYSHFRPEDLSNPPTGTTDRIEQLWLILNGKYEVPLTGYDQPSAVPLVQMVEALGTEVDELRGVPNWTLDEVVAAVKGLDNRSVTQVYDLVDALTTGSNQDVLDAIAELRGDSTSTVMGVLQAIAALRTGSNHTLQTVLDAIDDIPAANLAPVTDKLNLIQPSTSYSLTTLDADVAAVALGLDELALVVDAIKAIVEALPTSAATAGPPVWPGLDNVTLGNPVALSSQLVLTGPMHGVLVDVTVPPTKSGRRVIGGETFDYKSGEVAFESDNGYIEPWQYTGWRKGLYTPKSMTTATRALFRVLSDCEGTARTWISS